MNDYVIAGGLAGPWRKKKVENVVPSEFFDVTITVTINESFQVTSATADADFSDVLADLQSKKEIRFYLNIEGVSAIVKLNLASYDYSDDSSICLTNYIMVGETPSHVMLVWSENGIGVEFE